ncbi:MAG TPA: hypothetical protein VL475_14440 [Planctomycetaceae bacterium]|jgi:hypothetical protein|nr:hypothetical protein [Planctomycetaceae bacterium]
MNWREVSFDVLLRYAARRVLKDECVTVRLPFQDCERSGPEADATVVRFDDGSMVAALSDWVEQGAPDGSVESRPVRFFVAKKSRSDQPAQA